MKNFYVLGCLLALFAFAGNAVGAKTTEACETNVGVPGQLIEGYGMVYSPVAFDQIMIEGALVDGFPDLQDGSGVLVYADIPPGGFAQDHVAVTRSDLAANEALVKFIQGNGVVVHQCLVEIVAYDAVIHSLAELQVGDCNLTRLAGLPKLLAGHAQVVAFSQEYDEFAVGPPQILEMSTVSASTVYLLGQTPGMAVLAAIRGKTAGGHAVSLCPFVVASPQVAPGEYRFNEEDICEDVDGVRMLLSVGQTAIFSIPRGVDQEPLYQEFTIGEPRVLDSIGLNRLKSVWIIKAVGRGTSSLTALNYDGLQAKSCEVVVE